jgi:hypothetical protein
MMTEYSRGALSLALPLLVLCFAASGAEQANGCFELKPWKVGDKWVVQVNSRQNGPAVPDKFDALERQWEVEGKPLGIPIDEWLEKLPASKDTSSNTASPQESADSPYESWMQDSGAPPENYGPYKSEWIAWSFEVVAEEKLEGRECFRVKASREDLAQPGDSAVGAVPDSGQADSTPRKRLFYVYYFDVKDRSLVRIELCHPDGVKTNERTQSFGGGVPVHASFDSAVSPPAYFPVIALGSYDPGSPKEPAGANQQVPTGVVPQALRVLDDRRLMITLADYAETLRDVKTAARGYAKFFYEQDLPWWTEGYVQALGGIRARLYSVNGKVLERKSLGCGSQEQK